MGVRFPSHLPNTTEDKTERSLQLFAKQIVDAMNEPYLKFHQEDAMNEPYLKMYIAVLDEAPDYMVPTLVAHSILNAHIFFTTNGYMQEDHYGKWLKESFRKVVLRVTRKEFEVISRTMHCHLGHENTILNAEPSCAVINPVYSDAVPNVLKFAKLWKPK